MAIVVLALLVVIARPSWSCTLPEPAGEVILTVDGQIGACNATGEARFDLAMLEELPRKTVKSENPWEEGVQSYEGVLLRDLMAFVQASGKAASFLALNDYRADIDFADFERYDVILAYKRNGEYMPVREKGPLFVVYPFAERPELKSELRYAQSVWQVARITVR